MKRLKTSLSIRGDSYYCPLSFQLDTYWNCENACHHCYLRRLNRTWGEDLRPLDLTEFKKKIINGLKNKNPKSPLAHAIKDKKTIRVGNKSDPYQNAEKEWRVTRRALKFLNKYDWTYVIQTMFTENVYMDMDILEPKKENITIMPIITPGLDKDWELLEKKGTTRLTDRVKHAADFQKRGFNVGVNGEPFIPGYHTIAQFEDMLKLLKSYGIKSYNTYHLHYNDWVAKNFFTIGLDIEKIWYMNQDKEWKKILVKLIELSKKYDINLGCPDFVNSGSYQGKANTCCGMSVPYPTTFNIINWKKLRQKGYSDEDIIDSTYDGIGTKKEAMDILKGKTKNLYTLEDVDGGLF